MRYLLYMDHGARALIGVIALAFASLLWETRASDPDEKQKSEIQP